MDDTLLDFACAERTDFDLTLSAFGVKSDDKIYARYHEINDALWKALERGEVGREELKTRRFSALFSEFGIGADAASVSRFYFSAMEECCFPFEGAREFLKTLKSAGRVYLCTNGGAKIQRRHIELADFAPYLDGAFISEEVGADKPSAKFAECVAARIVGFLPENAVYLGDSLTSDLKCAEALGTEFVLFAPRGVPEYGGAIARNYAEALRLMLT